MHLLLTRWIVSDGFKLLSRQLMVSNVDKFGDKWKHLEAILAMQGKQAWMLKCSAWRLGFRFGGMERFVYVSLSWIPLESCSWEKTFIILFLYFKHFLRQGFLQDEIFKCRFPVTCHLDAINIILDHKRN